MRKLTFILLAILITYSCNMSDSAEKLPGGYLFIYEGGNQNRLIKNHHSVIDSGIVECKYKSHFLLVSLDTTYSRTPEQIEKRNLKYFAHNLSKDTIIQEISYENFQSLIKANSLETVDISK